MKTLARKITIQRPTLEHLGWYCTVMFLLAYVLASTGVAPANSLMYQLLNIFAASGYAFYAHKRKVYPSVFANIIWALVGAYAVATIVF